MVSAREYIELGYSVKPHGIRGGFSFHLHNTEESTLMNGSNVWLFPKESTSSLPEQGEIFVIESITFGNKTIAYLQGISDRTSADEMLPFLIKIMRDDLPPIEEENTFYISDMLGLKVLDFISKKEIGKIVDYYENGAQIIFSIQGSVSIDLPFVEQFFPIVDLENSYVEVIFPEVI